MIVIIKPVRAKVNLSRQNGESETTTGMIKIESHGVNIDNLGNLWTEVRCMKYEKS